MDLFEATLKQEVKRDILKQTFNLKRSIDSLIQKDFFKSLLLFYQHIQGVGGMESWMTLYEQSIYTDCEECVHKKLALVEQLMFQLEHEKLFNILDDLLESYKNYKEFIDVGNSKD